jgi:hypothetical protein
MEVDIVMWVEIGKISGYKWFKMHVLSWLKCVNYQPSTVLLLNFGIDICFDYMWDTLGILIVFNFTNFKDICGDVV